MLHLRDIEGGCELKVRVQPNAKRSSVNGLHGDSLKVAVSSPPIDGKANASLTAYIASLAEVSKSKVEVRRGEKSRDKILVIRGVSAESLRQRLEELGISLEDQTKEKPDK